MNILIRNLAKLLAYFAFISSATAGAYDDFYAIVICDSCITQAQFYNAGSNAAGQNYNGTREILVINSVRKESYGIYVTNTPPGQDPLGHVSPTSGVISFSYSDATRSGPHLFSGMDGVHSSMQSRPNDEKAISETQGATQGSRFVTGGAVAPDLDAQIGYIIDISNDMGVLILPQDQFPSYLGSEHADVSLALYAAMTEKFGPGWAKDVAGKQLWKRIIAALKLSKGIDFKVCALFANGDSACYEVYPGRPSAADLVDGSQKDVDGAALPAASSGGGSGDGLGVNSSGSSVTYSGNGGWVYVTITCIKGADGKLHSCTIQYQMRAN